MQYMVVARVINPGLLLFGVKLIQIFFFYFLFFFENAGEVFQNYQDRKIRVLLHGRY